MDRFLHCVGNLRLLLTSRLRKLRAHSRYFETLRAYFLSPWLSLTLVAKGQQFIVHPPGELHRLFGSI